eukprot:5191900-Prymnesium_polylepis.1
MGQAGVAWGSAHAQGTTKADAGEGQRSAGGGRWVRTQSPATGNRRAARGQHIARPTSHRPHAPPRRATTAPRTTTPRTTAPRTSSAAAASLHRVRPPLHPRASHSPWVRVRTSAISVGPSRPERVPLPA